MTADESLTGRGGIDWGGQQSPPRMCPMSMVAGQALACARDRCMWWHRQTDDEYSTCAVASLSYRLDGISFYLRTIARV